MAYNYETCFKTECQESLYGSLGIDWPLLLYMGKMLTFDLGNSDLVVGAFKDDDLVAIVKDWKEEEELKLYKLLD